MAMFDQIYERFKRFCTEWDSQKEEYMPPTITVTEVDEGVSETPTDQTEEDDFPVSIDGYASSVPGTIKMGSYFTIDELCKSTKAKLLGISNTPSKEVARNLQELIDHVLDPARREFGFPITVTSGYRCYALNVAVGGASNSQHVKGQAADLTYSQNPNMNATLFYIIREQGNFDQLIYERGNDNAPAWVHVSYNPNLTKQRGEVLRTNDGKTYYRM